MKKIILFSILLAAGLQATLLAQNNVTVQSLLGTHVDTILK